MAQVYVGIGSNIEPERHLSAGLAELQRQFGWLNVSTIYANAAVGFTGADFLNGVVGFTTDLTVQVVVARLRDIEAVHRNTADPKPASRALDLDLLLYDDRVLREGRLHLPRDEIVRHAFVLKPLAEIAGDRRHPLLGTSFAELWAAFDSSRETLTPVTLRWEPSLSR
ncbi:2-amino-4-hydroxy-6-hydroxymethyldihydropteridine diphosphokinase [Candidatus Contendibacter odensensis]|uniref:2-amino-4-hydroxy-6-hydroxymethyldihydropteridine diphosphokinase n=1 Tax=Candidatus Contendobacter odensis Run_B_J11 TaxID=1400861 RepID=A0A7U7GA62_9GAMM|nr:2-amino-4-hydroxy-6-hydroxymethyldihydropteridine diphosphokinase [Candidatus Contendobacter odensis]CDH44001.1 putative 2-amino-4-hydroxy-6-hydroxymethyldihydropteridine pyrophosphokinase [Candidatus Contendobacter odensis Run_B_J11]